MDGDFIVYRHDGKNEKVLDVNELNIIGRHNHENVMTAVAIAIHLGVPMDMIREACREFKAVEHRIEYVRERFELLIIMTPRERIQTRQSRPSRRCRDRHF